MPLTGHATVLVVEDVRRATDYYRDALGFDVELYDRIPDHYGYARRDGCHVHFALRRRVRATEHNSLIDRKIRSVSLVELQFESAGRPQGGDAGELGEGAASVVDSAAAGSAASASSEATVAKTIAVTGTAR